MAKPTAIIPKNRPKLLPLARLLEQQQVRIAQTSHYNKLVEIVEPFDSRITFTLISENNKGNYVTNIAPSDVIAGTNLADTPVTSKQLFQWLDEGTNENWIGVPDEFDNETFPNSLHTTSVDYDREKLFFLDEPRVGIDARNFLEQINDLYKHVYRNRMSSTIRLYLSAKS